MKRNNIINFICKRQALCFYRFHSTELELIFLPHGIDFSQSKTLGTATKENWHQNKKVRQLNKMNETKKP